jgi:hypothetical protein
MTQLLAVSCSAYAVLSGKSTVSRISAGLSGKSIVHTSYNMQAHVVV